MQRPSSTERQPHLNLLCKNVRGLSNDDRLEELLLEALFDEWDILLLSETWRETQREQFTTQDGHVFLGSGAGGERRGVAFLVHNNTCTLHTRICTSQRTDGSLTTQDWQNDYAGDGRVLPSLRICRC